MQWQCLMHQYGALAAAGSLGLGGLALVTLGASKSGIVSRAQARLAAPRRPVGKPATAAVVVRGAK